VLNKLQDVRSMILFYSRVLSTMSHISSKTRSNAIWYLKLLNKNDIRFLTCNNLYLKSSSLAIPRRRVRYQLEFYNSVQFMNSLMTKQSDNT